MISRVIRQEILYLKKHKAQFTGDCYCVLMVNGEATMEWDKKKRFDATLGPKICSFERIIRQNDDSAFGEQKKRDKVFVGQVSKSW